MSLESTLSGWTGPSSETEQEKQERTVRMIREAVHSHAQFDDCSLSVYAKGSFPNNTNVKTDSDVDIAVQCHEARYWDEGSQGAKTTDSSPYRGIWTPDKLRTELEASFQAKFPGQVDTGGSTAIGINSSSSRVDADVVPCFDYRYYLSGGRSRNGIKIFRKNGSATPNYPAQHLEEGRKKTMPRTHVSRRPSAFSSGSKAICSAPILTEKCRRSSSNRWCTTAQITSFSAVHGPKS